MYSGRLRSTVCSNDGPQKKSPSIPMEAISRFVSQQGVSSLQEPSVVFGSGNALDVYLKRVLREAEHICELLVPEPLDIYSGIPSEPYIYSRESVSSLESTESAFSVFDVRTRDTHRAELLRSESTPSSHHSTTSNLESVWAQMKYRDLFLAEVHPQLFQYTDQCPSSEDVSTASTTPSVSPVLEHLQLDPPQSSPPSKLCSDCGTSLLSTRMLSAIPGYCEYSGRLICGDCFDPRPQVIPWRLISGCETIRGKVSRTSSQQIQRLLYTPSIHYSDITSRQEDRVRISTVHSLRVRLLTLLPMIDSCEIVREAVTHSLETLPQHIRAAANPDEILLYSLGDLWDIIHPPGVCSIITRSLRQIIQLVESHSDCGYCNAKFSRNCEICYRKVATTSPEWRVCELCGSSFHRHCFRYSTDGCPICVVR
jgi:hypothetical protein